MAEESTQLARSVRQHLLDLHKALLDAERAEYERMAGSATPPAALLQMLITDPRFAWLRCISRLIVGMDEALSTRKPAPPGTLHQLLDQTRDLLQGKAAEDDFQPKYRAAIESCERAASLNSELLTPLAR